jgi:hypothetical protein
LAISRVFFDSAFRRLTVGVRAERYRTVAEPHIRRCASRTDPEARLQGSGWAFAIGGRSSGGEGDGGEGEWVAALPAAAIRG